MKLVIYISLTSLLFLGCASQEPEINFEKPEIQIPKKPPEAKKNKGSLYSMQGTSLFADKKDLQIGDIIQIVINEDLTAKSDNKRELTNDRNNSLGGGLLTPMGTNTLGGAVGNITNKVNENLGVNFGTESSTSDKGKVKTQYNETFETTISAIIEETYQNGNYYIRGEKEMLIEGQKQKIIISGVIRPYDITSDNSINSSQIANLKLLYNKDGTESDILDTPWGLNFMRKIWPF
ncbi:flagellar L-ring protein FlgH [Aliarcobacter butzleri 7h1h]|uniref:flagellar basal body L-ring protein FlgH n=1 Tax=Aliarcobacter butzleri TaxID=28197 RepID=UPI00035B9C26|nr:flagellar basal body L-ring protein FlgH [Aliarcobacter butzleri]AGR76539.1 flagellar L-ring protein FlgH [Aliarcobacter butzleri 7h1h]MCG3687963.1 flagellar basal body L-ring protein FlgH [Aliarcobacter butzleri]MCG3703003.1 flagellar basal body L-ring protein FlgH [Aliarcobacter butzleri]MCG3708637.1 flagellar basal body L-ring protein FlgH [Aliarcobacter butzleri]MDN5060240.1 flagellar basal body L-ring protein FlgH [Aliarcobacter butzleri]